MQAESAKLKALVDELELATVRQQPVKPACLRSELAGKQSQQLMRIFRRCALPIACREAERALESTGAAGGKQRRFAGRHRRNSILKSTASAVTGTQSMCQWMDLVAPAAQAISQTLRAPCAQSRCGVKPQWLGVSTCYEGARRSPVCQRCLAAAAGYGKWRIRVHRMRHEELPISSRSYANTSVNDSRDRRIKPPDPDLRRTSCAGCSTCCQGATR